MQHNNSTEETQCLTDDVNESDEAKITKEAKLSDQQVAVDHSSQSLEPSLQSSENEPDCEPDGSN